MGKVVKFKKGRTTKQTSGRRQSPGEILRETLWDSLMVLLVLVFGGGFIALATIDIWPPFIGCPVKGNISFSGERIYHVPGQEYYTATSINLFKGERWFCSEQSAIEAGWRKSRV